MNMKRILILIIGLMGVAYGQTGKTSAKTQFVNGLYMGTKPITYFNAADSNALFWRSDSSLMAKYKGTPRKVAFTDYVDSATLARLPIVNVKSYGALGDGTTDDRVAIKAAAAYAEQNGLPLYFPSGTYYTSGNLTSAVTRTNTTSFTILFGDNVKIKVIDTANFDVPSNRILFGYYTGTIPHSFYVSGGNVEIDGNNMINAAFVVSQTTNENLAFKIACANLKIKNLYATSVANSDTYGIYTLGSYPLMEIRNVTIDSVSRHPSTNLTLASQAILISGQEGTTLIDNVVIKNIGSTSLTQDCDGIVVRGKSVVAGQFASGKFTIQNSFITDSRGRGVKAQSSTVSVLNTQFIQQNLQTISSGASIDFQFGNGVVDKCFFNYASGTLGSSFTPIVFQENVQYINQVSKAVNNRLITKAVMPRFISVTTTQITSASADISIENNSALYYDTTLTSAFNRAIVEFQANEVVALPPSTVWNFTIRNNAFSTSEIMLGYTGYTSGDLSKKIRLNIYNNINTRAGGLVFDALSGNRIFNVSKYRFKGNSGWSNYLPNWNVDFTRGALMSDNEFIVDLGSVSVTAGPSSLPASGRGLIVVGDSSTVGQMVRITVGDSSASFYKFASNWVSQVAGNSSPLNYVPKMNTAYTLGQSNIYDDGTNVGIGTTSPTAKLTVQGATNIGDGTTTVRLTAASNQGLIGTFTNDPLVFRTNNTEALRIQTNGDLLGVGSYTGKRARLTSLVLNKDSVPITTTNIWGLTEDTVTGRVQRKLLPVGSVYTPTATNVNNTSNITVYSAQWMQVDNIITVSGRIQFDNTLTDFSRISLTLPVASTFAAVHQAAGTANEWIAEKIGIIRARTTDVLLEIKGLNSSSYDVYYTYTYRVL